MEPELTVLAMTAAAGVVKVLASDSWELAKKAIGGLWRWIQLERADTAQAGLDDARAALLAAAQAGTGEVDQVWGDLVADWHGRLVRLPVEAARLTADLRRVIDNLEGTGTMSRPPVRMRAHAGGHGRVYQSAQGIGVYQR